MHDLDKPTLMLVSEWRSPRGEVEISTENLANQLVDHFHIVIAVMLHDLNDIPVLSAASAVFRTFKSSNDLRRLIDEYHPRIVHFQQSTLVASKLIAYLNKQKIRSLVTLHFSVNERLSIISPYKVHDWSFISKLNGKTRFVATSPQLKQMAVENGITITDQVIPIGVDTNRYYPSDKTSARAEMGLPQDKVLILFMGHYTDPNIWKTATSIASNGSWNDIALVTNGFPSSNPLTPTLSPLETRGKYYNFAELDRSDERHPLLYRSADMFIMPSMLNGYSLPILEAIASGLPAIEPTSIGQALTEMRNNFDVYSSIGRANRQQAINFDSVAIGNAYKSLYRSMITDSQPT